MIHVNGCARSDEIDDWSATRSIVSSDLWSWSEAHLEIESAETDQTNYCLVVTTLTRLTLSDVTVFSVTRMSFVLCKYFCTATARRFASDAL